MATQKDIAFINFVMQGTDNGSIRWEPTARLDQFTSSFKGKYNVVVDRSESSDGTTHWVAISDAEGREILKLFDWEDTRVRDLFRKAQRSAFNVDAAIDEIMGG